MLVVKTYLDKSPINGIGLFAGEFIPKGKKIWIFTPKLDLAFKNVQVKSKHIFDYLHKYCFKHNGHYILCIDDARFINHSETPNADDKTFPYTIAARDIQEGEEITSDYRELGTTEEDKKFNYQI